ncbi:tubulin delta chain-like [Lytechinus variegatus]|uniref:tubulin delta chain-like n=1 Tax=Lytechinus variegatus TaxID=7654 RepID=UPI001BB1D512|nr:tubulin delta chain-like [Lytechinus variegatus]XP_041456472.1 tubulin delta chain-like [Lytechinus variegatus]
MSIVTVQLGQCGNQIGLSFFQTLMSDIVGSKVNHNPDYKDECLERFFHQSPDNRSSKTSPSARAVMVDMESKVIQNTVATAKQSATWQYPAKQQFCRKRGAGNNWADGFYGHGSAVEEQVLEMVQREVEKCDRFGGFLSLMSVAGGTGSGVGTRITQCLKDRYPQALLVNQLVWPHCSGEVILQNYNAVLSLAHLYECADAINIIHNDHMRKICSSFSSTGNSSSGVSFTDMNRLIAEHMALWLQPSRCTGRSSTLCDLMETLVSHPDYKLLTMYCVPQISEASLPFSTFAWPGLMKRLHQMVVNASVMEEGLNWQVKPGSEQSNKCISNYLILRGKDSNTVDVSQLKNSALYIDWIPPDYTFTCSHQSRQYRGYEKSACLMSNGKTPVGSLDMIVRKAWDMFAMRAYVHWYVRHGMEEEKFIDCFASLEQVLDNYKQL